MLRAYLGVNFDGNPNWVLIFDFPKRLLNNARLGIILFQTWHLSPLQLPLCSDEEVRPCYRSHKHLDWTAGNSEHSDNSSTHICSTRCPAKAWPKYSLLEITPSYIQVGMFKSPRMLFDQHIVSNVEIEFQDPLNSIPLLLSCDDPAAGDLLSLIWECCSQKEVVISGMQSWRHSRNTTLFFTTRQLSLVNQLRQVNALATVDFQHTTRAWTEFQILDGHRPPVDQS